MRHQRESGRIPDWAEIRILWLRSLTRDGAIMESDLFYSKFRLAGFNLNARCLASADKSFEQFVELLDGVSTFTNVITVEGKLVLERLQSDCLPHPLNDCRAHQAGTS